MSQGRAILRNSAFNFAGQLLPIAVAVLAIPPLLAGLGAARFGLLSLAWVLIGYFGLLELGLGRALTQQIANRLAKGETRDLHTISWTTILFLGVVGVLGGSAVALGNVWLVRVLNVPGDLVHEARVAFRLVGAAIPLVVVTAGLRAIMEAHQHFGLVNALRIPLSAFTFLGPLLVLPASSNVALAVGALVFVRLCGLVAHLVCGLRRYGFLRHPVRPRPSALWPLLRFGAWTTVTNLVSPLMVYIDRVLIGAIVSLAAVAHYVTPYEAVTKLMIIPGAILGAAFPVFTAAFAHGEPWPAARDLYDRCERGVVLSLFPFVLVAVALAPELLDIWTSGALPADSASVLRWIAVGVFINATAHAPFVVLQGAGRPDLIAKTHLAELPLYVIALWLLGSRLGIVGVAITWTLRSALDAAVLLVLATRTLGMPLGLRNRWVVAFLGGLIAILGVTLLQSTSHRATYALAVCAIFIGAGWRLLLTPSERQALVARLRPAHGRADASASIP